MLPPVRSMALLNLQVCLILCVIPKRSSRELEGCWRILPRFKGGRPWTGRKQAGPHLVSLKGKPLGSYMICWNIGKEEMILMLPQAWIMYDVVCYSSWSSSYVMLKWTSRESEGCQRRLPLLYKVNTLNRREQAGPHLISSKGSPWLPTWLVETSSSPWYSH